MPQTAINFERTVQSEKVARSAGVVSVAIAMSRVTGLVREMVMAQKFGAGLSYDAFLLGFRIPNLTRDLFAEGALSAAFVPAFTETLANRGHEEAERLSNMVASAIVAVVGLVCLLGMIFSPQLVSLLAPGYAAVPGKFALAVHLTRIMFPFLLVVALAAQAMGVLNAHDKFAVPAMASTFFNIGSLAFGLSIGFWLGPHIGVTPIEGMAYGVVLGGILQLAWQIPSLRSLGFHFRWDYDWSNPALRQIGRMMIPAILGNAAVQINTMVNTNLASRMYDPLRGADGPVSWLAYSFRFMQFPLGLFGVAFASAMLPSISRSAASSNFEEFRQTLSRSLAMMFVLTVPSSFGLIILGRPIIGALFQGGRFELYDTQQTATALSLYSIGLLGYAATKILNPAFYALSDAQTPMYISMVSVAVNFVAAITLTSYFHMGYTALALSTSVVAIVACLCLFELLRRKLGGIEGRYLLHRFVRIGAASLMMAIPLVLVNQQISHRWAANRWGYIAVLAVCLPLGVGLFAVAARMLGVNELGLAAKSFVRPFKDRLTPARAKIRN
ncbi:MAG: murein biosynthesis integral membrane protein MurJ [Bryobacteraceae bacterium]